MERTSRTLLVVLLTMITAAAGLRVATATEDETAAQDLAQVRASQLVKTALWSRQPDSYTVQIVLDRAGHDAEQSAVVAANRRRAAVEPRPEVAIPPTAGVTGRGNFFIRDTIANLRGVDFWIACGRTLTLIDGRRGAPQLGLESEQVNRGKAPNAREARVEVWLLKADGTQIVPADYSCTEVPGAVEVAYSFAAADGEAAVAVAVRIDSDYFIEKLQPLVPKAAVQQ